MELSDDDIRELAPAVRALIGRYFPRVPHNVADPDDLFQAAMVAIVRAAPRFDSSRGSKWSTWALLKAYRAMQDELRRVSPGTRVQWAYVASLDEPLQTAEDGATRGEMLEDEAFEFPDPIRARALDRAVGELSLDMQSLIALRFDEDLTLAEIGAMFGATESRVSQMLTEAVGMLRRRRDVREAVAA